MFEIEIDVRQCTGGTIATGAYRVAMRGPMLSSPKSKSSTENARQNVTAWQRLDVREDPGDYRLEAVDFDPDSDFDFKDSDFDPDFDFDFRDSNFDPDFDFDFEDRIYV